VKHVISSYSLVQPVFQVPVFQKCFRNAMSAFDYKLLSVVYEITDSDINKSFIKLNTLLQL